MNRRDGTVKMDVQPDNPAEPLAARNPDSRSQDALVLPVPSVVAGS
jgi:hypothetical protein